MLGWAHVGAAAAASGALVLLLISLIWRFCFYSYKLGAPTSAAAGGGRGTEMLNLQAGIAKLSPHRRINYSASRRGVSPKPLFRWADQPDTAAGAVENGWSGFGFTGDMTSSPSTRSAILALCAAGDSMRKASDIEIKWEISQDSAEFTQMIRFNPEIKNRVIGGNSVVRTALPLPVGAQEAYFEIRVLKSGDEAGGSVGKSKESERAKLIEQNSNRKANSESLVTSIGLTGGGSLPLKLPGSYRGSIGFNSNGTVFLDGTKLVFESENTKWGRKDQVIGCGFNPGKKKVFFTLDSKLVHVFQCHLEEFGGPLYPTLASNSDITITANFGHNEFTYAPANAHRTPNPCFDANSPTEDLGCNDSEELFSMSRIGSQKNGNNNKLAENFDTESEADLFEITLDKLEK